MRFEAGVSHVQLIRPGREIRNDVISRRVGRRGVCAIGVEVSHAYTGIHYYASGGVSHRSVQLGDGNHSLSESRVLEKH